VSERGRGRAFRPGSAVHPVGEEIMGMHAGPRRRGAVAEINVTPLIDVLLVLLVVFMVIQQARVRQGNVQVPPPSGADAAPDPAALVLEVAPGRRYALNRQPIDGGRLAEELRAVLASRSRRVLFVKGDDDVPYGDVAAAVDAALRAGADGVGLVPR
jgi:biopolymer transport protein TolR